MRKIKLGTHCEMDPHYNIIDNVFYAIMSDDSVVRYSIAYNIKPEVRNTKHRMQREIDKYY